MELQLRSWKVKPFQLAMRHGYSFSEAVPIPLNSPCGVRKRAARKGVVCVFGRIARFAGLSFSVHFFSRCLWKGHLVLRANLAVRDRDTNKSVLAPSARGGKS